VCVCQSVYNGMLSCAHHVQSLTLRRHILGLVVLLNGRLLGPINSPFLQGQWHDGTRCLVLRWHRCPKLQNCRCVKDTLVRTPQLAQGTMSLRVDRVKDVKKEMALARLCGFFLTCSHCRHSS
jgi:hypothetical protein